MALPCPFSRLSFRGGSFGEADAQACRDQQIVPLSSKNRVAQVPVAGRNVPSQPFLQRGDCADVHVHTILPGIREIGKYAEDLREIGSRRKFVQKIVAEVYLGGVAAETVREVFARIVAAPR